MGLIKRWIDARRLDMKFRSLARRRAVVMHHPESAKNMALLSKAAQDRDLVVQRWAMDVLRELGLELVRNGAQAISAKAATPPPVAVESKRLTEFVFGQLATLSGDWDGAVRERARHALEEIGQAAVAGGTSVDFGPDLVELLQRGKGVVDAEAARLLELLLLAPSSSDGEAIAAAPPTLEVAVKDGVAKALGGISDARAAPYLLPLLRSSDWRDRDVAIHALAKTGYKEAVPDLLAMLAEGDEEVRKAAAHALKALGDRRGAQALAEWRRAEEAARPGLKAALIIFTRDFSPKDQFVDSILDRMEARGKPYREWMDGNIPLRICVDRNAQEPITFLARASIEFRRVLNEAIDLDKVDHANFSGSDGISGVIVTLWKT